VGSPGDASYDPSLPGLSGDFRLQATWTAANPLAFTVNSGDSFGFFDVKLEAGKFLKTALGPIVQDIISTLKPVQPILDTISAPIPVLSDLSHLAGGDDVTLVSLASAFGGGSETVRGRGHGHQHDQADHAVLAERVRRRLDRHSAR